MTPRNLQSSKLLPQVICSDFPSYNKGNLFHMPARLYKHMNKDMSLWVKSFSCMCWTLKKHHYFLCGQCFMFETDQKSLKTILNRSIVESSPYLKRLSQDVYHTTSKQGSSKKKTIYVLLVLNFSFLLLGLGFEFNKFTDLIIDMQSQCICNTECT